MTTAPITVSMTLPLIARPRAPPLARRPRLVVAGRARPPRAAQDRAGRPVGGGGAGQVRLVRLLPRIARPHPRHRVHRMVQPGVPFRRHLRALRLAAVDDPAPLAAEAAAAATARPVALQPVIAVAVGVG